MPSFLQTKLNDPVYNKNLNALLHKHASELKQQTHKEPVSSLKLDVGFASVSAHIWDVLRHLRNVDTDSSVNTDFAGCSFFKTPLSHAGRSIADVQWGPATQGAIVQLLWIISFFSLADYIALQAAKVFFSKRTLVLKDPALHWPKAENKSWVTSMFGPLSPDLLTEFA